MDQGLARVLAAGLAQGLGGILTLLSSWTLVGSIINWDAQFPVQKRLAMTPDPHPGKRDRTDLSQPCLSSSRWVYCGFLSCKVADEAILRLITSLLAFIAHALASPASPASFFMSLVQACSFLDADPSCGARKNLDCRRWAPDPLPRSGCVLGSRPIHAPRPWNPPPSGPPSLDRGLRKANFSWNLRASRRGSGEGEDEVLQAS